MQEPGTRYVSIPPVGEADISYEDGRARLSVERTIVDLVAELDSPEDLDAVIRTALRHDLTTPSRLRGRAASLARAGHPDAEAVLDSMGRLSQQT